MFVHPNRLQRRHVITPSQAQISPGNDDGNEGTTETRGGHDSEGRRGLGLETQRRFEPQVRFFFHFSFNYTNVLFLLNQTRTHPRCKRKTVGRFLSTTNIRTHPRCKRESVGRFYATTTPTDPTLATSASRWGFSYISLATTPQTPPSLQARVGGVFSITLATTHPQTHPRCKREPVGCFYATTHPQTPPSLQA
jgi:hypothetical protein